MRVLELLIAGALSLKRLASHIVCAVISAGGWLYDGLIDPRKGGLRL